MSTWRTYLADEHGEDLTDHPLHGGFLVDFGELHSTPGLGIGREVRGFYNVPVLGPREYDPETEGVELRAEPGKPIRLKLWKPDQQHSVWVVAKSTDRREVERLREVMWPWAP